jgi:hypothetical protein
MVQMIEVYPFANTDNPLVFFIYLCMYEDSSPNNLVINKRIMLRNNFTLSINKTLNMFVRNEQFSYIELVFFVR